jgi:hypothetical protein
MCFKCTRSAAVEVAVLCRPSGALLQRESGAICSDRAVECEQTREQKVSVHSAIETERERIAEHQTLDSPHVSTHTFTHKELESGG